MKFPMFELLIVQITAPHPKSTDLVLGDSCNYPLVDLFTKHFHPDKSKINKLLPPYLGSVPQ